MIKVASYISVQIVYALPDYQRVIEMQCKVGTNIKALIKLSGICEEFPEIDLNKYTVGVYGYRQPLDYVLNHLDRLEIYRPLKISPTDARRLRARSKN